MYEKLLTRVMSDDVTLEDWKAFKTYADNLPPVFGIDDLKKGRVTEEQRRENQEQIQQFGNAARHVASKLSLDEVSQDVVLLFAYEELHHPEKFS